MRGLQFLFWVIGAAVVASCAPSVQGNIGGVSAAPACIEGQGCDDGDVCTEGEVCTGGQCVGGRPMSCDDGLWCNGQERCVAEQGCVHENPPSCVDAVDCTED